MPHDTTPLWGLADLHAHPASHLGFGAEVNPDGSLAEFGIFWGKPGLSADTVDLAADLPPCDVVAHNVDDGGLIRTGTRTTVLNTISELTGHPHQANGWKSFTGWPHA